MSNLELEFNRRQQLVNALLMCDTLSRSRGRDDVVRHLPDAIRNGIDRGSNAKSDVVNLLDRCLNYEGGLQNLLDVLESYEDDSLPFNRVIELLNSFGFLYITATERKRREAGEHEIKEAEEQNHIETEHQKVKPPPGYLGRIGRWIIVIQKLPPGARIAMLVTLAAVIVLGSVSGISLLVAALNPTPTMTPTHSPAPTLPVSLADAQVDIAISSSNGIPIDIPAGGALKLSPGEKITLQIRVRVGQASFPRPLTYEYFAPAGTLAETSGSGTSYVAPKKRGTDFIVIVIKDALTGDELVRSLTVSIEEP